MDCNKLKFAYPEFDWYVWKMDSVPIGFWDQKARQRQYLDWLADDFGIEVQDDWYKVSLDSIRQRRNAGILHRNDFSLLKTFCSVYPEYHWQGWKFQSASSLFWNSPQNRRDFFDWIAEEFAIEQQEDWYNLSNFDFKELGAFSPVALRYQGSSCTALKSVYPEFTWHAWDFQYIQMSFWSDVKNQRTYLDWFADETDIETADDWYEVALADLNTSALRNFSVVTAQYQHLCPLLSAAYPEFQWFIWRFRWTPRGHWDHLDNQRKLFDWLAEQFNLETFDDWHRVTTETIISETGYGVLHTHYGNSLIKALCAIYPEKQWRPWKFHRVYHGYWDEVDSHRKFFDSIANELQLKGPEDWQKITTADVVERGGYGLLQLQYGNSLFKALSTVYPEYDWSNFMTASDGQRHVWLILKSLLRDKGIYMNFRHPLLSRHSSKRSMELDIWIPALKLAFEYQGGQHYQQMEQGPFRGTLSMQKTKDEEKRKLCKSIGITLIEIPYWWDCTTSKLAMTIQRQRPEIALHCTFGSTFPQELDASIVRRPFLSASSSRPG